MLFKDIKGQEKAIAFLKSVIGQDRVAHAYIFHGLDGIGKRATALAFAKALNCLEAGSEPCGECLQCRKIERGSHPDVITIQADGAFIRIKEIRELQEQMMFRPAEGRKRVFIILEAEKMNGAAANALLKTLEEPSGANILVLVTARPHQLPLTVLSRCQRIKFQPLRSEDMISLLEERFSVDARTSSTLAAISGGSLGKALEMKDNDYAARREELIDKLALIATPLDFYPVLAGMGSDRDLILEGLEIMKTWFRDIVVFGETGEDRQVFNRDRIDVIREAAGRISKQELLNSIKIINAAVRALEQNANRQLLLEMMMFRLFRTGLKAAPGRTS
ncbi:MAG: DNA polymerase III subunit delta' [Syntrophaceae bacterium]